MTSQLKMNVWVEMIGGDGVPQRQEVASVIRDVDGAGFEDFGLTLGESKNVQRILQAEFVQFQVDRAGRADRVCMECGGRRGIHDYRPRTVHSLFGVCRMRVPRFDGCACPASAGAGRIEALLKGRATPELERVQAELGSRVLNLFAPAAHNHRTVSNRLAKVADRIEKWDQASPYRMSRAGGSLISVFIDGAYIRAVPGYQSRHFEIAMGACRGQRPATASIRGLASRLYRQA